METFIIAEAGVNHNGDEDLAIELIDIASEAQANAIKFQTYTPDTITIDSDREEFLISDASSIWHGRTLYDLYEEAHTPWEWHKPMFECARSLGVEVFSSPFDISSVDFLEDLNVSAYKIASLELSDTQLIKRLLKQESPLLCQLVVLN